MKPIRNIVLVYAPMFFIFCGLYGLKLSFLPVPVIYGYIVFYLCLMLSRRFFNEEISPYKLSQNSRVLAWLFCTLVVYVAVTFFASKALDLTLVISAIVLTVTFFLAWILSDVASSVEEFLGKLFVLISLQAIFIIASFLVEPFREAVDLLIDKSFSDVESGNWRMRGVSNVGGSALSIVQGIGLLIGVSLLLNGSKYSLGILFGCLVMLLSIIATGKSGLLAIPICLILVVWDVFSRGAVRKSFLTSLILVIFLTPLVLYGFYRAYIAYFQVDTVWGADALYSIFRRASGEYVEIFLYGKSRTLDYLLASFQLPSDYTTLLFGDHDSWALSRYSAKHIGDSGYLRQLWAFGLVGCVIFYSIWVYMAFRTISIISNSIFRALVTCLFGWMFLMQFKEPYLLLPPYFFVFSLLFFIADASSKDVKKTGSDR